MNLLEVLCEVRRHLEENGRVTYRMLRREFDLDDEALEDLVEELVEIPQIAVREGNVLVWSGESGGPAPRRTPGFQLMDVMPVDLGCQDAEPVPNKGRIGANHLVTKRACRPFGR